MPEAQPGQEQRMGCDCPERTSDEVNYGIHACRDGKRIAPEDLYLTRPTADLGEDGEFATRLRNWQGDMPDALKDDLAKAADRIEALARAVLSRSGG